MHDNELIFTRNGLTNRLTLDQYLAKHQLLIFHIACNYQFDSILIAYHMGFKPKSVSLFETTALILAVTINFSHGRIPFPLSHSFVVIILIKNQFIRQKNRLGSAFRAHIKNCKVTEFLFALRISSQCQIISLFDLILRMIKILVRIIVLAIFLYEWNYRCGMQERAPPDHPFKSSQQYGSQYRYLTVLNYLLSIFINFLLLIGAVLPTG